MIINLSFENGSVANISYFSNGQKDLPKERLEVFSAGTVALIDDFKSITTFGKKVSVKKGKQDKGHFQEVELFLASIKNGLPSPIPFEQIDHSMFVTFKVIESIALAGKTINIS